MKGIILIPAFIISIILFKEIKLFIIVKYFTKEVKGKIIRIEKKETFTRNINILLQGGKSVLIKLSYQFIIDDIMHQTKNDKLLVSTNSKFNMLKENDEISIYVYKSGNNINNTWLIKPKIVKLLPYILLLIITIFVFFLSNK